MTDGSSLPASVGNGTFFSGFPNTDLKTAIETAGDLTQIQVEIKLVGTQFGVLAPDVPMPANISLANDGYNCPSPAVEGMFSISTRLLGFFFFFSDFNCDFVLIAENCDFD